MKEKTTKKMKVETRLKVETKLPKYVQAAVDTFKAAYVKQPTAKLEGDDWVLLTTVSAYPDKWKGLKVKKA